MRALPELIKLPKTILYLGIPMTKCKICDTPFEQTSNKRPKEYCSTQCAELCKFLNAFDNRLMKIDFKEKSANRLKSELFQIANKLKCN